MSVRYNFENFESDIDVLANLILNIEYIGNHSGNDYFLLIIANFLEINNRGDSRINEGKRGG